MARNVNETHQHYEYSRSSEVPFKTIKYLGKGTFGVVDEVEGVSKPFRAHVYARKMIWIPPRKSAEKIASIQNEVKVAKKANHVHLVRLVATYVCGKEYAMIMEPVAEQNLGEYLAGLDCKLLDQEGFRLRDQLLPWFGCLVSATNYLHLKNIRHRDIKPSNILILAGKIFLTDFGISKELPGETLSLSTETCGTPRYRAPEVHNMHRFGRKSDIFSLGAVFLEMLTVHSGYGQLSRFNSLLEGPYSVNLQSVFQWVDTLSKLPRDIPWYPTMLYICRRMLQPNHVRRPTAITLQQCWSYQPFPAFPTKYCTCDSEEEECQAPEDIDESLQKASRDGHTLMVDLLIEMGADINDSGALFAACQVGQKEVVELLIHKGADTKTEGALHQASVGGFEDVVQILLDNGADVNAKHMSGCTALHSAARFGHYGVARILATAGADVNATDDYSWTALHRATTHDNSAVAQLLVQKGADVDAVDNQGWTALHRAAMNEHKIVARLLIEDGADINADNDHGRTPLHLAAKSGQDELVQLLLQKKANPNAEDNHGRTPLHLASKRGHTKVVRLLIEKGSNIHAEDNYGQTALKQAIKGKHNAVVQLLRLHRKPI
jgi:ankyrin repeat protein/serine/threonine protein kinase